MAIDGAAPVTAPTKRAGPAGQRRLLSLVLTIAFGLAFGLVAAVAFAAWSRSFLGDIGAIALGLVLAWLLPLFLAVRATLALKRRNPPATLLRRFVAAFLVVVVQLTVFLAGFVTLGQGTVTTAGEMAAAGLPVFGKLPVVGGLLDKQARDGGALDLKNPADPAHAGVDPTAGAGASSGAKNPDGTPVVPAVPNGLSPRAGGRPIGALAAGVVTTTGDVVVVIWTLAYGGAVTPRVVDLSAFSALGNPTRVEVADDGSAAIVLAGAHLLTVKAPTPGSSGPGAGHPGIAAVTVEHDKLLSRGGKVSDLDIQQVKDVAVAPGGALLLTVDAYDAKKGAVRQALVARPVGGAPYVVRKAGDVVDAAVKEGDLQNLSRGYAIKANSHSGAVVVEEEFLEGEADVGMKLSGATWVMNPRRLLVGQIDNPRALAELVRSGDDPSGVENVSLQAFGDAALLADGRAFFDANFVEEGARGWLFNARSGGGAFAVGPELIGKPEAPFSERAPRTRHLVVDDDGACVFVNRDGALLLGTVQRLQDSKVVLQGDAVRPDGSRAGGIASALVPRLSRGGEWLASSVELLADAPTSAAGARIKAILWASRADLAAGKAEVLLEQGGLLPTVVEAAAPDGKKDLKDPKDPKKDQKPAPGKDERADPAKTTTTTTTTTTKPTEQRRVKTLFFFDGHDEPLWQAG